MRMSIYTFLFHTKLILNPDRHFSLTFFVGFLVIIAVNFQTSIDAQYRELQDLSAVRRQKLLDNQTLFDFFRESDEVVNWMKEREVIASSEDYGTDLEHVELLQQKFDNFLRDLQSNEERVSTVRTLSDFLISDKHSASPKIEERCNEVVQMWNDVNSSAVARQEVSVI